MFDMTHALQTNALLRTTTGSGSIFDTIVATMLAALIGYLFSNGARFSLADGWAMVRKLFWPKKSCLVFGGRLYYSVSMTSVVSDRFIAVTDWMLDELMHGRFAHASAMKEVLMPRHLRRSALVAGCTQMFSTARLSQEDGDDAPTNSSCTSHRRLFDNGILILDQAGEVRHSRHPISLRVTCTVSSKKETDELDYGSRSSGSSTTEYCECEVTIASEKLDMMGLKEFVDTHILQKFQERAKEKERGRLSYYIFTRRDNDCGTLCFDTYPWTSNKQFHHVHSEQTARVEERVMHFVRSRAEYKAKGQAHALKILMHGPPGCGKTSLIKAIANATRRNVIDVSLPRILTRQMLMDLFHDNGRSPPGETVFVLDDIDRMGKIVTTHDGEGTNTTSTQDTIANFTTAPTPDNGAAAQHQLNALLQHLPPSSYRRGHEEHKKPDDPLTLSDILNVMDGMLELDGVIIIITANHPEKLDDALTRPGRINMRVHMGRATAHTLRKMLHSVFSLTDGGDGDNGEDVRLLREFDFAPLHERLTPAFVEGLCTNTTLAEVLRKMELLKTHATHSEDPHTAVLQAEETRLAQEWTIASQDA